MTKHRIRIVQDDDPQVVSQDNYDYPETIYYKKGSRYILGDEAVTGEEMRRMIEDDGLITAPVYAYVHGAVKLSLGPFDCPWDSGMSGLITYPKSELPEGEKYDETWVRETLFPAAIQEWNDIANGNVWGFVVEKLVCEKCDTWENVDSCCGFVGDESKESMWEHLSCPEITKEMFEEAWEEKGYY